MRGPLLIFLMLRYWAAGKLLEVNRIRREKN